MPYYVSSGQVSSGINLNNDSMYVYYSGTAVDTTLNHGNLDVFSGGTATDVDWTPCVGVIDVQNTCDEVIDFHVFRLGGILFIGLLK